MHTPRVPRARIDGCSKRSAWLKLLGVEFSIYVLFTTQSPGNQGLGAQCWFRSALMSLDFFFVPLAAKVGASLDQVKASGDQEGQD